MVSPRDHLEDLTAKSVRERFDYDAETGVFRYRITPKNQARVQPGDIAGYIREGKYLVVTIYGRSYYLHRLAWLYVYDEWPKALLDHVNGNKQDNRICNLRPATQSQNIANTPRHAGNTSGYKGVVKCKNRWKAQITHNQVVIYLGLFPTKEEAHEAYVRKAKELHGEFAHA